MHDGQTHNGWTHTGQRPITGELKIRIIDINHQNFKAGFYTVQKSSTPNSKLASAPIVEHLPRMIQGRNSTNQER